MKSRLFLLLTFVVLTSCSSSQPAYTTWLPWQIADMHLLKSPDTPYPASDLIAIYSRMNGKKFQIRLDLLDMQPDLKFDVFILLDTSYKPNPTGFPAAPSVLTAALATQQWDQLLVFPYFGKPSAYQAGSFQPVPDLTAGLQRDFLMDAITISMDPTSLPDTSRLRMEVFITSPGGRSLLDQSPPVSTETSTNAPSAPLLLSFKDVFKAVTPAQALRRWDGAHTGPIGSRHGLEHILTNVDTYNVPVVLLDLKTPQSLAAVDLMDGTALIKELVDRDLLILPDVVLPQPALTDLQVERRIASEFNLPGSQLVYSADLTVQPGYIYQFSELSDRTHLLRQMGKVFIPLADIPAGSSTDQASIDGLELELRIQLLSTALSPDPTDLVVLGGSLTHSSWGNADISTATFAYIATHPWIRPLNGDQLQSLGSSAARQTIDPQPVPTRNYPVAASNGNNIGFDSGQLVERLISDLNNAPHNTITDSAWQMFNSQAAPADNESSTALNYLYVNQVESLLFASKWAENPIPVSDCSQDIDLDTQNECILANRHMLAIFETDGGRLSFLFVQRDGNTHQLVGPQSQLTVGLSDPSLWDLQLGPAADPAEIPGAFSDVGDPFSPYIVTQLGEDALIMERSDGRVRKTFRLLENGISMDCSTQQPVSLRIPLILDPQTRFQSGWQAKYNSIRLSDSYRWGISDSISIEVTSTASMSTHDFTESRPFLASPENPNLEYPAGHFLPFPMALVEVSSTDNFSVQILAQP